MFRRDWLSCNEHHNAKGGNTEDLYEIFVYVMRNAVFSGMYGYWSSYCLKNNFHVLAALPLDLDMSSGYKS